MARNTSAVAKKVDLPVAVAKPEPTTRRGRQPGVTYNPVITARKKALQTVRNASAVLGYVCTIDDIPVGNSADRNALIEAAAKAWTPKIQELAEKSIKATMDLAKDDPANHADEAEADDC